MALFDRPEDVGKVVAAIRAELARASESRPAASELLAALPDAAAVFGEDERVRTCNAAFDALHAGGSAAGHTVIEVTRDADLGEAVKAALLGEMRRIEVVFPADGRTMLAHVAPLPRGEALLVLHDITASRRLEGTRRDFVANASHELRTPVAAIAAAVETLLSGSVPLSAEARSFVEMIGRQASRLSRLTADLLDLSRLEAGEWPLALERLPVAPVARAAVELFRGAAAEKKLAFALEADDALEVMADRQALDHILANLLDNAVKYSPPGSAVTLRARREGREVMIAVSDTGAGIEARHLGRLFERFYRVDTGRSREVGGTGLGLAIVKHLAQAQGGSVGVDSGAGGSTFWVRLRVP